MGAAHVTGDVREVAIRDDGIRLGQLLKLAGLIESGAAAKALLAAGEVTVDGQVETRRGRKLRRGAVVTVEGESVRLT